MIRIVLQWRPLSTQHIYWQRGRIRYMKKEAKLLKASYIEQARSQYAWKCLETPLSVEIKIYFWDRRKRDWDNYHKLTMDALEWILYKDDSQIQIALVTKAYDKENPCTVLDFIELCDIGK